MISKLNLVTFIMALVAASSSSMASAKHLKVHVHQDKSHQGHHQKLFGMGLNSEAPDYLEKHFDDTFAVCSFWHQGAEMRWFSIGFFGEDGSLLETLCKEKGIISLRDIKEYSTNIDAWKHVQIDQQSECVVHENEAKDPVDLMNSYDCKSWYEFWK